MSSSNWLEWGIGISIFLFSLTIVLVAYAYFAICLMRIARRLEMENAWWAWIPILNLVLMFQLAGQPEWWVLLMFIPVVNIIVGVVVWAKIAEALGKPNWWGLVLLVPGIGFIVPGYLAFSSAERV